MAKNYLQQGDVLDYLNDNEAAIVSGAVVVIGKRVSVALTDIAPETVGAIQVVGVFNLPKAAEVVAMGTPLYWKASPQHLTKTATGNTLAGFACASTTAADKTIAIKINA